MKNEMDNCGGTEGRPPGAWETMSPGQTTTAAGDACTRMLLALDRSTHVPACMWSPRAAWLLYHLINMGLSGGGLDKAQEHSDSQELGLCCACVVKRNGKLTR